MPNSGVTLVLPIFRPTSDSMKFLEDLSSRVDPDTCILLIDNGNCPSIAELMNSISPWHSRMEILRVDDNRGWGGAVRIGAEASRTHLVCWAPTNGKLSADTVLKFIRQALALEKRLVKAYRANRSSVFSAKARLAGLLHTIILRKPMWDSGGTPTLAERSFLLELPKSPQGPAFDAFVMFHAASRNIPIERIRVKYQDLPKSQSSWRRGFFSEIELFAEIASFRKTLKG